MSIEPGYSGQEFMPEAFDRIARLRDAAAARCPLQVDGGVDDENIERAPRRGRDLLVAAPPSSARRPARRVPTAGRDASE